jgi:hypothetical protein
VSTDDRSENPRPPLPITSPPVSALLMAQLKTGLGMRLVPADAAAASFAAVPIIDLAALSSPDVAVRQALALQVQAVSHSTVTAIGPD